MNLCTFDNGKTCSVLRRGNCKGCSFFKTEEQLLEGRAKARERLFSLPKATQVWIQEKYRCKHIKEELYE